MADIVEPDVSSLLAQISNLGKSLYPGNSQDAEVRKELRLAGHDLSRALEEPGDIVERVCFSVSRFLPAANMEFFSFQQRCVSSELLLTTQFTSSWRKYPFVSPLI